MAKVTVTKCDGCAKVIDRNSDHFQFNSKPFADAAGSRDWNTVKLDLCERCIRNLISTINRIAEKREADNDKR